MSYISPKEITTNIRKELKAQFPTFKFSVTRKDYNSISVAIMKGTHDFGTTHEQVNHYQVANHWTGQNREILEQIVNICTMDRHIESEDADYGSIPNYYLHISIGKWDKPYENTSQEVVEEAEEETPETSTEQVEETNPVQVKEITVLWHEGNNEDQFEGTYESFEQFNKTVMNQGFWKDQRGAKISLKITFTNHDSYRIRYYASNVGGNETTDLRQIVLSHVKRRIDQKDIKAHKYLSKVKQYINNTPLKKTSNPILRPNKVEVNEPTPAQRNEIIATLTYQSQIAAIKLVVKILQVRLEEALELVSKLSREIEPSQA